MSITQRKIFIKLTNIEKYIPIFMNLILVILLLLQINDAMMQVVEYQNWSLSTHLRATISSRHLVVEIIDHLDKHPSYLESKVE